MQCIQRIVAGIGIGIGFAFAIATALAGPVDPGTLDSTFGSAGKVQIGVAATGAGGSNLVATDVALQSTGKTIVAGYNDNSDCVLARLNVDGSIDTTFGGTNGFSPGFAGYGFCSFSGIAVRADDRIVAAANQPDGVAVIDQFTADGVPDYAGFGSGSGVAFINPASGDTTNLARVVIESNGTIDAAGFYHQQSSNNNQFLFAQISADGKTVQPLFQYEFGSGDNQDDHALDLAIDNQGRYVVVGYHRGAGGNYDFAAIRIRQDLYDVDNSFGSAGQTTVAFDLGGDNGDFCNAVTIFKSSGNIVLGGHASATASNGAYQAAALAELDSDGNLYQYFSGGLLYPAKFVFSYSLNPTAGQINDIARLIVDGYDTKYPQLLAIGSGNQYAEPGGVYFGIARLNPSAIYSNFSLDPTLNGKGVEGVYFAERPTGLGNHITTNYGYGAVFADSKLIVAGYTLAPGGKNMAVTRLAAFDGIFKNGFDEPSY